MNVIDEETHADTATIDSSNSIAARFASEALNPNSAAVLAILESQPERSEHRNKAAGAGRSRAARFNSRTVPSVNKENQLRRAASTNNTELVLFYLKERQTNPNAGDHCQRTALHLAAAQGYVEVVKLLIEHGANVNARDMIGNTPLHLASCLGSGSQGLAIVKLLLQAGTDLEIINSLGNNPLDLARSKLRILLKTSNNKVQSQSSLAMIIEDFSSVVDLMIHYQRLKKQNVDDLCQLASKIATLSTEEAVTTEISSLLSELDALKL